GCRAATTPPAFSGRNDAGGEMKFAGKRLRRWTRRYSSQRDEFYHAKQTRSPVRMRGPAPLQETGMTVILPGRSIRIHFIPSGYHVVGRPTQFIDFFVVVDVEMPVHRYTVGH